MMICADSCQGGDRQLTTHQEQALRAVARGELPTWPGITAEQSAALHATVSEYAERYRRHHLPHGQNADIRWQDGERSTVAAYEGIGDSAAWTGHYLAALAIRYRVTGDKALLPAIGDVLDVFDLLTTVTGRLGYIARFAAPAEDPAYQAYYRVYGRGEDPERPGLGRSAYRGAGSLADLVWLGNSSRDTYDGAGLGLAMTWAYVDDEGIRNRVRGLAGRIANRLIGDDWYVIDGKGHRTRPTPWWNLTWMRIALTVNPEKYAPLEEDYESLRQRIIGSGARVRPKWTREYFPNNLMFVRMLVLCTLEPSLEKRAKFQDVLRDMYLRQASDHLNPHFAAIYMIGTGNTEDPGARTTLQGMLLDYPDPPKLSRAVDHRDVPGVARHGEDMAEYPFLTRNQVPTDFLWQRSPCLLHGSYDLPIDEFPALDLILPYWMGRACGAIP